jgi:hypothetical protein
LEEQF